MADGYVAHVQIDGKTVDFNFTNSPTSDDVDYAVSQYKKSRTSKSIGHAMLGPATRPGAHGPNYTPPPAPMDWSQLNKIVEQPRDRGEIPGPSFRTPQEIKTAQQQRQRQEAIESNQPLHGTLKGKEAAKENQRLNQPTTLATATREFANVGTDIAKINKGIVHNVLTDAPLEADTKRTEAASNVLQNAGRGDLAGQMGALSSVNQNAYKAIRGLFQIPGAAVSMATALPDLLRQYVAPDLQEYRDKSAPDTKGFFKSQAPWAPAEEAFKNPDNADIEGLTSQLGALLVGHVIAKMKGEELNPQAPAHDAINKVTTATPEEIKAATDAIKTHIQNPVKPRISVKSDAVVEPHIKVLQDVLEDKKPQGNPYEKLSWGDLNATVHNGYDLSLPDHPAITDANLNLAKEALAKKAKELNAQAQSDFEKQMRSGDMGEPPSKTQRPLSNPRVQDAIDMSQVPYKPEDVPRGTPEPTPQVQTHKAPEPSTPKSEHPPEVIAAARNAFTEKEKQFNKGEWLNPQQSFDAGKHLVETGQIDPVALTNELISKPRAVENYEVGALTYHQGVLEQAKRKALGDLIDARKKGLDTTDLEKRVADAREAKDRNLEALQKVGRSQSSAFFARTMAVNSDMEYASLAQEWEASHPKKTISPEIEKQLKEIAAKHEEALSEIARIQGENERLRAEKAVKSGNIPRSKKSLEQLRIERAEIIKNMGRSMNKVSANPFLDPEIYGHLGKLAKNLGETLYRSGELTLKALTDAMRKELGDHSKDFSDEDLHRAISGNHPRGEPKPKAEGTAEIGAVQKEARVRSNAESFKRQAATGEAEPVRPKTEKKVVDPQIEKLIQQTERLRQQAKSATEKGREQTVQEHAARYLSENVISGLGFAAKVSAEGISQLPVRAVESLTTPILHAVKVGGKSLAEMAPAEAPSPGAILGKVKGTLQSPKQVYDFLKTGTNEPTAAAGHRPSDIGFGRLHGAMQSIFMQGDFEGAMANEKAIATKKGLDIENPDLIAEMRKRAGDVALERAMRGPNVSGEISGTIRRMLRSKNRNTRNFGLFLHSMAPIRNLPANFLAKTLDYAGGAPIRATTGIIHGIKKGGLTEAEAVSVSQAVKRSLPAAVGVTIALNNPAFWKTAGFATYKKGQEILGSDGKPLKPGESELFGHRMHLHGTLFNAMTWVATIRDIKAGKITWREFAKGGARQIPGTPAITSLGEGDTRSLVSEAVPAGALLRGIAEKHDVYQKDTYRTGHDALKKGQPVKRATPGPLEQLQSNIPIWRESLKDSSDHSLDLPVKGPKESDQMYNAKITALKKFFATDIYQQADREKRKMLKQKFYDRFHSATR